MIAIVFKNSKPSSLTIMEKWKKYEKSGIQVFVGRRKICYTKIQEHFM